MHDIITLGSASVDVFVETEKQTAAMQVVDGKEQPFITYRSGEKILIKNLQFEIGGGGTNTAACFSKLGLKTAYLGNVGTDNNGENVIKNLKEFGVEFLGTRSDDKTNYSVILESALLKDRTILIFKEASERLLYNKIPGVICKWLYVSSLSGESFRTAQRVATERKNNGAKIAFNPSNYQIEHSRDDVLAILRLSDVAVMNREEAVLLVGEGTDRLLCEKIIAMGPSTVAVTMGSKGVVVHNSQECLRAYPTPNIKVRETTGAGDCFAASFVGALAYEQSLVDALRWGLCNVENHIQHIGAKAGLMTKSELQFAALRDSRAILQEP